jgi:sortase A
MRLWLERLLIAIGLGCLVTVGISMATAASSQETAAQTFMHELVAPASPAVPAVGDVLGRLEIPRAGLSVMVREGDDAATLARAVGHVPGTALPWDGSNAVLAGHRDTFFRPLGKIRHGDEIRWTTSRGTFDYRVIRTEIVEPDNLSVLAPSPAAVLTLVTCYPFAYVGPAPKRFIVHAVAVSAAPSGS